jgi:GntR family transcriptional regulator, carbon starvation induced regulator
MNATLPLPIDAAAAGQTIADTLRQAIRLDIVCGRLAPGTPLRTQSLCDAYGCSMAPLREALSWLAADGLVASESQRGFRVASVSREEWQDLIARRLALEREALALSIRHGDDDWESRLVQSEHRFRLASQRLLKRRAAIDDDWEAQHRALHIALIAGCGSPWLLRWCHQLYDHCDRYRRLAQPARATMERLDDGEHELVAAALARDRKRADALMRDHIAGIADAVLAGAALWQPAGAGPVRRRLRVAPRAVAP